MCGICAVSIHSTDSTFPTAAFMRSALIALEHRGRDASGIAWCDSEGDVYYDKAPLPGSVYARTAPLPAGGSRCRTALIHTRAATNGSPSLPVNNHPHVVNGTVGVHNGIIWNDDDLHRTVGRLPQGTCDSEAIFAALAHLDEPVIDTLARLRGDAALAWVTVGQPDVLHLAVTERRPMAIAHTARGSLVMASTMPILDKAALACGLRLAWRSEVPEWTHLIVRDGVLTDMESITPPPVERRTWDWRSEVGRPVARSTTGVATKKGKR